MIVNLKESRRQTPGTSRGSFAVGLIGKPTLNEWYHSVGCGARLHAEEKAIWTLIQVSLPPDCRPDVTRYFLMACLSHHVYCAAQLVMLFSLLYLFHCCANLEELRYWGALESTSLLYFLFAFSLWIHPDLSLKPWPHSSGLPRPCAFSSMTECILKLWPKVSYIPYQTSDFSNETNK